MITRREFVGGSLALGATGLVCPGLGECGTLRRAVAAAPNLRFGVMSDVHIGGKPDAAKRAEKALR